MSQDGDGLDVSVVIPVLDGGDLLRLQLAALERQDFAGSWEVVVADNGSVDGTLEDVRSYSGPLVLRAVDASDRRGVAHARNVGARLSNGRWIAYCDADDEADPGWLGALYAARGKGDLVAGLLEVHRLNRPEVLQARGFHRPQVALLDGPGGFLPFAPASNLLVERSWFDRIGGWDEDLPHCEDVEFSWRAQVAGATLVFAPAAVMHYRLRPSGRDLFRQLHHYRRLQPRLFAAYARHGAEQPSWTSALRQAWWLASRLPYTCLDLRRRMLWLAVAADATGNVRGRWQQARRCRAGHTVEQDLVRSRSRA